MLCYVGFSYAFWEGNQPEWHHIREYNLDLKYAIFKKIDKDKKDKVWK